MLPGVPLSPTQPANTDENDYERSEGQEDNGRTILILSRNSFAQLKTGMASPTIALVAPMASIVG